MSTEVLAAGTTAANSIDIVVATGAPINVGLARTDENPVGGDCVCPIMRKDGNGDYGPTGFILSNKNPSLVLVGAGTYQVRRPAIDFATSIETD